MKRPWVRWDVDCVLLEDLERDGLERSLMRRGKHDVRGCALDMRLKPARCRHAPPIPGNKAREAILRHRRDQIVADALLVLQELSRDHGADRVTADVFGTRMTAPVTEETGEWVDAAGVQRPAKDVELNHERSISRFGSAEAVSVFRKRAPPSAWKSQ